MMGEMDNVGKENAREKSCTKLYGGKCGTEKCGTKIREEKCGKGKCGMGTTSAGRKKCEKAKYGRKLQG